MDTYYINTTDTGCTNKTYVYKTIQYVYYINIGSDNLTLLDYVYKMTVTDTLIEQWKNYWKMVYVDVFPGMSFSKVIVETYSENTLICVKYWLYTKITIAHWCCMFLVSYMSIAHTDFNFTKVICQICTICMCMLHIIKLKMS